MLVPGTGVPSGPGSVVPHGLFHVNSAGLAPVSSAERDVGWRQRHGGYRGADSQFLSVPAITGCLLVTVRLAPCGPAGLLIPRRLRYPRQARPGSRLPWPPAFWLHPVCRFWWAGSLSARTRRGPRNLEEHGSGHGSTRSAAAPPGAVPFPPLCVAAVSPEQHGPW